MSHSQGSGAAICRWVFYGFFALYVFALTIFAVGHLGLFGYERDPLASVYLIPLGLPWNRLLDFSSLSDAARLWLGVFAPVINLFLIGALCRALRSKR